MAELFKEYKKRIVDSKKFTRNDMEAILKRRSKSEKYKKGKVIKVTDRMTREYTYKLTESIGKNYAEGFAPGLTPPQMLKLGVFEGKYCNDCILEYPVDWYVSRGKLLDTLSPEEPNPDVNYFKIKSRLDLSEWKRRKWIPCTYTRAGSAVCKRNGVKQSAIEDPDIRGWFQWYCRYYLGRRLPIIDDIQIQRWKNFKRHLAQLKKNCGKNMNCRRRQRQALLQWAYDIVK